MGRVKAVEEEGESPAVVEGGRNPPEVPEDADEGASDLLGFELRVRKVAELREG